MTQKIFDFKGLYQSGRRMDTPLGYFRRLTNTFKDRTGRLTAFGLGVATTNQPAVENPTPIVDLGWGHTYFSAIFKKGVFSLIGGTIGADEVGRFRYLDEQLNDLDISQPFNSGHQGFLDLEEYATKLPAGNFTSAIINNKLFICEYVDKTQFEPLTHDTYSLESSFALLKFDGIQVMRAGLPTPWRLSHNPTTAAYPNTNTRRLRYMYMTLDLSGEVVFGNYIEEGVAAIGAGTPPVAAKDFYNIGGYDGAAVLLSDPVGTAPHANGVGIHYPKTRDDYDRMPAFSFKGNPATPRPNYYPKKWAEMDTYGAYVAGDGVTATYTEVSDELMIGDWLMFAFPLPLRGKSYDAYYFKVADITPGTSTIKFSHKFKGFNTRTVSWEDLDFDTWDYADEFDIINPAITFDQVMETFFEYYLTNLYCIVAQSDNAAGSTTYNVKYLLPILWGYPGALLLSFDAAGSATYAPFDSNFPLFGVITSDMSDWYEISEKKTIFPPVKGITSYRGLLVGFDDNVLYFSDTSVGGSIEMVSGLSNLVPGGEEFGKIVAICGSENFLLVSRELKNFILVGDITQGNLTECDEAVSGAANAAAVTNAFSDKIIFMNKQGVFSVNSSGQILELSQSIRDLFLGKSIDGNPFDNTVFRSDTQRRTDGYDGGIFKIAMDVERGLVLFMTGQFEYDAGVSLVGSNILVFDTKDGSWYEFTGNSSSSIEVISGKILYLGTTLREEQATIDADAAVNEHQVIAFNYLTLGEPSLQKQVNQVKIFGDLGGDTITIQQQNNYVGYVAGEKNTDVAYAPTDGEFEHKHRLNASKARSTSVIFKNNVEGGNIQIEGLEMEMEPLQQGIKE